MFHHVFPPPPRQRELKCASIYRTTSSLILVALSHSTSERVYICMTYSEVHIMSKWVCNPLLFSSRLIEMADSFKNSLEESGCSHLYSFIASKNKVKVSFKIKVVESSSKRLWSCSHCSVSWQCCSSLSPHFFFSWYFKHVPAFPRTLGAIFSRPSGISVVLSDVTTLSAKQPAAVNDLFAAFPRAGDSPQLWLFEDLGVNY